MNSNYDFEPLVEILKFSEVKNGDVLILRCEPGKENEEISKMHSVLKSLIIEKDLRILAVNPNQDLDSIFLGIQAAQNFQESFIEQDQD
jgi:hypothetical protein